MKIWISRWALTNGIEEREIDKRDIEDGVFRYSWTCWLRPHEWHRTRLEALRAAMTMIGKTYAKTLQRLDELDKLRNEFKKEIANESASSGKQG